MQRLTPDLCGTSLEKGNFHTTIKFSKSIIEFKTNFNDLGILTVDVLFVENSFYLFAFFS